MDENKNLTAAGLEIEAIIRKYDVSGFVTLWEPNYRDIKVVIDPSFSCVKISKDNKLRVIRPIIDPKNDTPGKKVISDTVNMLTHLGRSAMELANNFRAAMIQVRQEFGLMPPMPTNGQINKNGN